MKTKTAMSGNLSRVTAMPLQIILTGGFPDANRSTNQLGHSNTSETGRRIGPSSPKGRLWRCYQGSNQNFSWPLAQSIGGRWLERTEMQISLYCSVIDRKHEIQIKLPSCWYHLRMRPTKFVRSIHLPWKQVLEEMVDKQKAVPEEAELVPLGDCF